MPQADETEGEPSGRGAGECGDWASSGAVLRGFVPELPVMDITTITEWFAAGLFFGIWGWGMARVLAMFVRFLR